MRARARSSSSSQRKRSVSEPAPARVEPRLRLERGGPRPNQTDILLLPIAQGAVKAVLAKLGARLSRVLGRRVRDCDFRGRPDEVLTHHGDSTIVLLGVGAAPAVDAFRRAGARGRQEAERARARRVQAWLGTAAKDAAVPAAFCEGFRARGLSLPSLYVHARGPGDDAEPRRAERRPSHGGRLRRCARVRARRGDRGVPRPRPRQRAAPRWRRRATSPRRPRRWRAR
jgi:hypothetical protein